MKGDVIPDRDHVARLCGGSHVREDGSVAPTAFRPRPSESYLSVNWLEAIVLAGRDAQIAEICRVLASKRTIGRTARLAILSVGAIHNTRVTNAFSPLQVRHEPETEPPDVSHGGIYGVTADDLHLHDQLAQLAMDVLPVKSLT